MIKKGVLVFLAVFMMLFLSSFAFAVYAEDQLLIKFHSEGDGKNITVDLKKYFPDAQQFFHNPSDNVSVDIDNGIATIVPVNGWKGDELLIFSPNATLAMAVQGAKDSLNITNIEPVIEMAFPDVQNFGAAPGNIEFSVSVFDPDNDFIDVEWVVNGVNMKQERARGGIISRFRFNDTGEGGKAGILRDVNFSSDSQRYLVTVIVNDSKNFKMHEWKFSVINASCLDIWKCGNWSDCIDGKHLRDCLKRNPQCPFEYNKPSTEWLDPNCAIPHYCNPNWSCGDWGICTINYDKGIISKGLISDAISTKQERVCQDTTYCVGSVGIERRECKESVPIKARTVDWCFDKYVEVYNADSGLLLSRIRESRLENQGLDIEFSLTDLSKMKRCWYCFNGIKDYDESDIDCGGSCEDCAQHTVSLKNSISDFRIIIFFVVDALLILFLFRFIRRK